MKRKISKKCILLLSIVTSVYVIVLFTSLAVFGYYEKTTSTEHSFTEIKPAVSDEYFAVGVIKGSNALYDKYVVKNMQTNEEIILPSSSTVLVTAQDEGEMRGGVEIQKNGFGEITSATLFLPGDSVMREITVQK